jgi:NADPH:quinone reductase-like Zn-dependent oxidoreductase
LFERAKLQSGEHLLVHGGAGAVGAFVIQLARRRGAYVTATASAGNAEFVRGLGADQVIDYRAVPFEEEVREVDVVFDGVGGETLRRSWGVLKGSGRLVTIAAESEATPDERSRQAFFIVRPDRRQLLEVGGMLDRGELRAVVDTVLPFSRAGAAYSGKVERSGRGKVVVALFDEETQA